MYMYAGMTASLRIALPITSMRLPWEYVHTHTHLGRPRLARDHVCPWLLDGLPWDRVPWLGRA